MEPKMSGYKPSKMDARRTASYRMGLDYVGLRSQIWYGSNLLPTAPTLEALDTAKYISTMASPGTTTPHAGEGLGATSEVRDI